MLKTTYKKDLDNNKMFVTREFAGSVEDVWKAFTDSNLLDQWWAPNPWKSKTKKMDFRNGGSWLYAMVGPAGEQHWAKASYSNIQPFKSFDAKDAFTDENGVQNADLPEMNWKIMFKSIPNGTRVDIEITFASQKDLEKIVEMGFQEGFTAAHDNLDKLLEKTKTVATK